MAKASLVNEPMYELRLSENEAKLVKALTQNCLLDSFQNENPTEKKCRESIFHALQEVGVE